MLALKRRNIEYHLALHSNTDMDLRVSTDGCSSGVTTKGYSSSLEVPTDGYLCETSTNGILPFYVGDIEI